jgi:DNA-binding response OmpR family regulator
MADARLRKIHILLVEDDRMMQKLVRSMLEVVGFNHIHIADDGTAGIDHMRQQEMDIIICDWKMQPMDGLSFVNFIRNSEDSPNRYVPIIMLTGRGEQVDVERARDAGVTEYLVKPFSVNSLFERLKQVIENPRDFVLSPNYRGPDRRRKNLPPPDGTPKRSEDREQPVATKTSTG